MFKVCLFSSWMTTQEPWAEDSPFVVPPVLQINITITIMLQSQVIVITLWAYLHSRKQRPQFEGHHEFKGSSGSIWGPTVQVGGGAKGASTIWLHFIRISLIMTLENVKKHVVKITPLETQQYLSPRNHIMRLKCHHHCISSSGELGLCPKVGWVRFRAAATGSFGHVVVPAHSHQSSNTMRHIEHPFTN